MWLKINDKYHLDPIIWGKDFIIACDDVDGTRIVVKRMKSARRKMLEVIRRIQAPAKPSMDVYNSVQILDGKLSNCSETGLWWKSEPFVYTGTGLVSKSVVCERPKHGIVLNEAGEQQKEMGNERTDAKNPQQ